MNLSETNRSVLLDLAHRVIRRSLDAAPPETPQAIDPPADPEFHQTGGCFVSLHEIGTHRLRGCVGRLDATQSIWLAAQQSAQSVLEDPRFCSDAVKLEELARLEIEITLVSPLCAARDPYDFDLSEHGIYLTLGTRSGCFLPQVARETGWHREQLLDRLCTEKLGMAPTAWQDPAAIFQRFTVQIIGPTGF